MKPAIIGTTKHEILRETGLAWSVKTEELRTVSGIVVPDRIAIVREDNSAVLGVHTPAYVPYQNEELLDLLFKISGKTGLTLHTGGMFRGGEKIWFQLKSDTLTLGEDKVEGFLSGFNSFDGRTSLAFGNATVTVSCENTFFLGYRQVNTKLRHSSTMKPRIDEILHQVDVLLKNEQKHFQEIIALSLTPCTPEIRELVTRRLFEISVEERLDSPEISTNKRNKMDSFTWDVNYEMGQKGDNLWGLFSGVTRYTTHTMKRGDNSFGKIFGKTGNIERNIFHELVEMV